MYPVHGEQPFWFWNGSVNKEEVRRQIFAMKEGGASGFFLHPRQGLNVPYMSNQFLDIVHSAVDAAKDAGMEMWLYDEYPYPSGVSGGEILANPDYRAHFLHPYCFTGEGLFKEDLRWGTVLYAKAFPVKDGVTDWQHPVDLTEEIGIIYLHEIFQFNSDMIAYNRKRFFTGDHAKQLYWQAPAGQWKVYIFIDHEMDDFKYFGCFVDPLNKDAIAHYIATTHERYKKAFGEEFGKTVKGIFTDETSPMGSHGILWSRLMPELFEKRNGYSLIDHLPALMEDTDIDNEKFLYDFNETVYEAFVESYDKPIRAWCDANNLIYTGEKPHLRAEQCSFMTLAGTDNGHLKCGKTPTMFPSHYRGNAKVVSTSNHFFGQNVTLCEAYHSLGWDATLRDMRWMVDWLGIDGINFFVPHAFYYSEDALRKHDAAPSFFENMPWWRYNTLYTRHIAATTKVTQYGKRHVDVLVLDPKFCVWAKRGDHDRRGQDTPLVRMQRSLSANHIDYYVIDRNLMKEAAFENGKITLRGETFRAVILPGMDYVEAESRDFVENTLKNQIPLFALDQLPKRCLTDGKDFVLPADLFVTEDENKLAQALTAAIGKPLSLCKDGAEDADVPGFAFDLDGVTYVYSANVVRDAQACQLRVAGADRPVSVIDTVTGEKTALNAVYQNGSVCFDYTYAPFAPALFAIGLEGKAEEKPAQTVVIDPNAKLPFRMENDNLLRLGLWEAQLGPTNAKVDSMPVIDQLLSVQGNLPIAEKSDFGCLKKLQFPTMPLRYEHTFDYQTDCPLTFAMEPGAVSGEHHIYINDTEITDLLKPRRVYSRGNLACDITPFVRKGLNRVIVTAEAKMDHDGVVNPLYLAGKFACTCENGVWTLREPQTHAAPNRLYEAGMPFYCGQVTFDLSALAQGISGKTGFSIDDWTYENACELLVDGQSLGARAWNPFRWMADLQSGSSVSLSMATTLLGAYEGGRFDMIQHATVSLY